MQKRIILHIGGEKTGTTALQTFLFENAPALGRAGFVYPADPRLPFCDGVGHFPVAASLIDGDVEFISREKLAGLPIVLETLKSFIEESEASIILSCEHFSSRLTHKSQLERLRDSIGAHSAEVVFYLRDQCSLALSAYSTGIMCGRRDPLSADEVDPGNPYYNHLSTLDLWSSVFGSDRMHVREFSNGALVDGDICHDFCSLLGIECRSPIYANGSLDLEHLEAIRLINQSLPEFSADPGRYHRCNEIRVAISPHFPPGSALGLLLSEADRRAIKERFEPFNREICERYAELSPDWFPASEIAPVESRCVVNGSANEVTARMLGEAAAGLANQNIDLCYALSCANDALQDAGVQRAEAERQLQEIRRELEATGEMCSEAEARAAMSERELAEIRSTRTWRLRTYVLDALQPIRGFAQQAIQRARTAMLVIIGQCVFPGNILTELGGAFGI